MKTRTVAILNFELSDYLDWLRVQNYVVISIKQIDNFSRMSYVEFGYD